MILRAKPRGKQDARKDHRFTVNTSRRAQMKLAQLKLVTGFTMGQLVDLAIDEFERNVKIKPAFERKRRGGKE